MRRYRRLSLLRAVVTGLLMSVLVPAVKADMVWFQRDSSEWFLRNTLNFVPLDSQSYFNAYFDDATSSPEFSEDYLVAAGATQPIDLRLDLSQPANAFAVDHEIVDVLQSGGAGADFSLVYEFFDASGMSLGKLSTHESGPPEQTGLFEFEVPRVVVDAPSEEICVVNSYGRGRCYTITTDSGSTGTGEENPPTPNPFFRSFEYAFVSLDEPIASLAITGDIETLFFVDQSRISLSGIAGDYDFDGFAAETGFSTDDPSAVPLPASLWFFLSALGAFWGFGRRVNRSVPN